MSVDSFVKQISPNVHPKRDFAYICLQDCKGIYPPFHRLPHDTRINDTDKQNPTPHLHPPLPPPFTPTMLHLKNREKHMGSYIINEGRNTVQLLLSII